MMKKALITTSVALLLAAAASYAQTPIRYVEAYELGLVGKLMDTPNPYHRVDTVKYKGFTPGENLQVRCPAGMAVAFRTDARTIYVSMDYATASISNSTMILSSCGVDLYARDGKGNWVWAANKAPGGDHKHGKDIKLIDNLDGRVHEFLMYLPIYADVSSMRIGVADGDVFEALESPFRHRVVVFGSSYTHGISTSRAGMSYPMQFTRHTGIQMVSLGCSGNCKMQDYFAAVLADVEADAFVFDAFSNPNAKMIEERLFPFIEKMQAAHPGVPLIFQQTIYRENRNFNMRSDESESAKQHVADSLMRIAVKRYKDVYFIEPDASDKLHESSVDGVHPDDYGYYLWSRSIEKPIIRILRRYGIR